jgi:hypothetical protein
MHCQLDLARLISIYTWLAYILNILQSSLKDIETIPIINEIPTAEIESPHTQVRVPQMCGDTCYCIQFVQHV